MPDDELLITESIELVKTWLVAANRTESNADRRSTAALRSLVEDPDGVAFAMRFIDRVARSDDDAVGAQQLRSLVREHPLPGFIGALDRSLLKAGAAIAPLIPRLVMPLARRRMRQLVGHLVVDRSPKRLRAHLTAQAADGFSHNVNALGEAVLGHREAQHRFDTTVALIENPDVHYVSIKLSSIVAQLNHWDFDGSVARVSERLAVIFDRAAASHPTTFVNLDMEEYHDLELTVAAFTGVLDHPDRRSMTAGIVLQAYLPDSFAALQHLVGWAKERVGLGGAPIKIRLVKGANLAMERVEAATHGWHQAPYVGKPDVDANYKRCLDWVLTPERTAGTAIGVASHNLFDVAWAHLLAEQRGVAHRVQFEMLQGMAPTQARVVNEATGDPSLLLYTPIVGREHFDTAISYLFRRLEENAAPQNFIRSMFGLTPDSPKFRVHADAFAEAVARRWAVSARPRRSQDRPLVGSLDATLGLPFTNASDTDPVLAKNRQWARTAIATPPGKPATEITTDAEAIGAVCSAAREGGRTWRAVASEDRRRLLHQCGAALEARRGELISAMVHEANKTVEQADAEVSEAVDFARYYGDRAVALGTVDGAEFEPFGVVAVIPPWNFPVAIVAGGVLAALASGNAAVLKPAPETPRCAEVVADALWAAGIPPDALHLVRTPDNEVGRRLIESVDAVILTGSTETAALFQRWNGRLQLFAETSGKNALIITPQADIDLAVADLVASAFGHAGQKCSAASLAICVGDVYQSPRFRNQLVDAVESLVTGDPRNLATDINPLIGPAAGKLARALGELDDAEEWLVAPRKLDADGQTWSPGVRIGVSPGSWFHTTECFGPVLGVMAAADLDEAIALQNATEYGLTGGIHSLDPGEVDRWLDAVQVGNGYVNRGITGAMVQRQPFGGWKRSSVGPGAKAGGPNYLAQLGTWRATGALDLDVARSNDEWWWANEFSIEHDATGLEHEANIFRYRPDARAVIRVGPDAAVVDVDRIRHAAETVGATVTVSDHADDSDEAFAARLANLGVERIRLVGGATDIVYKTAAPLGIHIADDPVTGSGYLELRHFVREQAISHTMHRFGNLIDR